MLCTVLIANQNILVLTSDSDWSDDENDTPPSMLSGSKAGYKTPESGYSSGNNVNQQQHEHAPNAESARVPKPPLNPQQKPTSPPQSEKVKALKKQKPVSPHKNLKLHLHQRLMKWDQSTFSVKDRANMFCGAADKYQKQSLLIH